MCAGVRGGKRFGLKLICRGGVAKYENMIGKKCFLFYCDWKLSFTHLALTDVQR